MFGLGVRQHNRRYNGHIFLERNIDDGEDGDKQERINSLANEATRLDVSHHHALGQQGLGLLRRSQAGTLVGKHLLILVLLILACYTWTKPRRP